MTGICKTRKVLCGLAFLFIVASTSPAGTTYYADLTGHVNIWDLSGTYEDDSLGCTISYTISQDSRGKFTGSGTASCTVHSTTLDMEFEIKGAIRQRRDVATVKMRMKFEGTATRDGEVINFSGSERVDVEVNGVMGMMEGWSKVSMRAGRERMRDEVPIEWSLPADMDGSCEVSFTVEDDGRRLAGFGQVILSNGNIYDMSVRGRINDRNNEGSFTLRGEGDARGFRMRIETDESTGEILGMKGKGLGQNLEFERP